MDDLTKLSGPELAAKLALLIAAYDRVYSASNPSPECVILAEAARRLREDDRVWQRNLERERDELRERVRELERVGDLWADENARLVDEIDVAKETCTNQRKELHSLNVERKATLTKLEDAQKRIVELEAQLREAQNAGADEWTADGEAVPEPAERKAQEERRYGIEPDESAEARTPYSRKDVWRIVRMSALIAASRSECTARPPYIATVYSRADAEEMVDGLHARRKLSETLATLDAVRALAEAPLMTTTCRLRRSVTSDD